tara:strand:+ start:18 stop:533 length:516 start_codon:yes stop_codon:yes gene_type:complete
MRQGLKHGTYKRVATPHADIAKYVTKKGESDGPKGKDTHYRNEDSELKLTSKEELKKKKAKEHSKKLEEGLEKAGYSDRSLDEVKSGSQIGSIDTAGRIRQGIKKGGKVKKRKNTSRENRLEELGRVDAEKAFSKKGKRNLKSEKKRIVRELHSHGGSVGAALRGFGAEIK